MTFRIFILIFFLTFGADAYAADKSFDQAGFDQARKEGGPVLLMVHADWCPTCRAQAPVVARLLARPEFSRFRVFRMDYDTQKGFVRAFRVGRQSALLVFKGEKEVERSIGETNEDAIALMMRKAL